MSNINIQHLFVLQKDFEYQLKNKKRLEERSYVKEKILGSLVELGELCNEWQGFKYWKTNNEPRTVALCGSGKGVSGDHGYHFYNPLLEEYVDTLRMFLAVGLEYNYEKEVSEVQLVHDHLDDIQGTIIRLFSGISVLIFPESVNKENWLDSLSVFVRLGELLGFSWEQVQIAFAEKQKINLFRQESGY